MLDDLGRDLRHAVRQLASTPAFTAVALVTLALGVGANTAIFSVVNGLLLRPLPYPEPDRVLFVEAELSRPEGEVRFQLPYPDVEVIRAQARTLAAVTAWNNAWGLALEGTEGARRLEANFVGRDYFSILGVAPLLGRTFTSDDHAVGGAPSLVVMLSEAAWRQDFGADPGIAGRAIRLQGRVFTVIGVMPASFTDPGEAQGGRVDAWAPIERAPELITGVSLTERGSRLMWAVARLAPGATVDASRAELRVIGRQLAAEYPATHANFSLIAEPMAGTFFADARRPLWFLLAGSIFVLLIGCANVVNLLLVRATQRSREFAVRQAVGASIGRLVRQLLAESVLLAGGGAIAGLWLASWLTPLLVRASRIDVPAFARIGIDGAVLAFTLATALASAVLFGLAPIWRAARSSVRDLGSGRVAAVSPAAKWLAGVEMTAAFVLVGAALLMLQSFSALTRTDLQFRSDRLLTIRLELPQDRYRTPASRVRVVEALQERLRGVPGVEQATIWGPSMFSRSTWVAFLSPTDRLVADDERLMVSRHSTNPGALSDLGIRLLAGRDFAATDTLDTAPVAILSSSAAARLWPGEDAVGKQLRAGAATSAPITVIGIAADARHRGRFRFSEGESASEPQLDIYLPFAQRPNALVVFGVRSAGDPSAQAGAVRAAIAAVDPTLPTYDIATLDSRMRLEESPLAFAALLINLYGGLALLLAGVGVYGVMSAAVTARMRELGIRAALGARPATLRSEVIGEGLRIAVLAIGAGGAAAWLLSQTFSRFLFGVSGGNQLVLAACALVLMALALTACAVPARRASRIDPLAVLRSE